MKVRPPVAEDPGSDAALSLVEDAAWPVPTCVVYSALPSLLIPNPFLSLGSQSLCGPSSLLGPQYILQTLSLSLFWMQVVVLEGYGAAMIRFKFYKVSLVAV